MTTTTNLGLTLVEQAQAQKEVTVNQALVRLDAAIGGYVIDKDLSAPPASPLEGDMYLVAASPTGAWATQSGKIAYFNQLWRFITPKAGMSVWVADEACYYAYNGTSWNKRNIFTDSLTLVAGAPLVPTATNGCAPLSTLNLGATIPNFPSLDFDASSVEYASCLTRLTQGWNAGTISAQFHWSHASTSTNFGVVWQLEARSFTNASSINQAHSGAVTIADTGGSTNTLYLSDATPALTITGSPAAGDLIALRVSRLATDSADTLAIDARLHQVVVSFTRTF